MPRIPTYSPTFRRYIPQMIFFAVIDSASPQTRPRGYWLEKDNIHKALEYAESQLGIKQVRIPCCFRGADFLFAAGGLVLSCADRLERSWVSINSGKAPAGGTSWRTISYVQLGCREDLKRQICTTKTITDDCTGHISGTDENYPQVPDHAPIGGRNSRKCAKGSGLSQPKYRELP